MSTNLWQRILGVLVLPALVAGCQSWRVERQSIGVREAVANLYTEQLLDNMVRAKNHQPFVQIAVRDLLVQETDVAKLAGSIGEEVTDERGLALITDGGMTNGRSILGTFSIDPELSREGILSFHADPIVDNNSVYDSIVRFANDDKLFTRQPGRPDERHPGEDPDEVKCHPGTRRKVGDLWYFVRGTDDAAKAFLDLALATSVRLEKRTVDAAYEVEIEDDESAQSGGEPPAQAGLAGRILRFDRLVPNGSAVLIVEVAGSKLRINLARVPNPGLGELTRRLFVADITSMADEPRPLNSGDLDRLKGRLYSFEFPPELVKDVDIGTTLRRQNDMIDQFRANQ